MKRIPQNEIYRILSGLAGTVGLYVEDCQSGEIFTINPVPPLFKKNPAKQDSPHLKRLILLPHLTFS